MLKIGFRNLQVIGVQTERQAVHYKALQVIVTTPIRQPISVGDHRTIQATTSSPSLTTFSREG